MELEVREIPPQSRGMYSSRMRSYKQEMGKLEADFKRSRIAYSDEVRNELLGDDGNSSENQRAHLLDNTERLERSSRRLEAGYQIAVETEMMMLTSIAYLHGERNMVGVRMYIYTERVSFGIKTRWNCIEFHRVTLIHPIFVSIFTSHLEQGERGGERESSYSLNFVKTSSVAILYDVLILNNLERMTLEILTSL
ncbi:vesicle transport through interaction with t-SNAREs homolog 1A isoform X10 [Calonectris borealis]